MTSYRFLKVSILLTLLVFITGCSIHGRHHYGYRHSGVHVHGHVHGRPSQVIGAIIAGAIIGHAINAIIYRERDNEPLPSNPGDQYYLLTKNGSCQWVEVNEDGFEQRTEVDYDYCSNND